MGIPQEYLDRNKEKHNQKFLELIEETLEENFEEKDLSNKIENLRINIVEE